MSISSNVCIVCLSFCFGWFKDNLLMHVIKKSSKSSQLKSWNQSLGIFAWSINYCNSFPEKACLYKSLISVLFLHHHRSQLRPCSDVYAWRLICGGFLSCSEVTDRPNQHHLLPAWGSLTSRQCTDPPFKEPGCWKKERGRENKHSFKKSSSWIPQKPERQIVQVGWRSWGGMWTMSMAWLCLPAFTVLLVGCFHTAVTESDVTPRLTFTYSKFYLDYRITTASQ